MVGDPLGFTHQQQEVLRFAALPFDVVTRALFVLAASSFRSKLAPLPPTISTNIFCRSSKLSPWNIHHPVGRSGLPLYPFQMGQWTNTKIYINGGAKQESKLHTSSFTLFIMEIISCIKSQNSWFEKIKKIRTYGQRY